MLEREKPGCRGDGPSRLEKKGVWETLQVSLLPLNGRRRFARSNVFAAGDLGLSYLTFD